MHIKLQPKRRFKRFHLNVATLDTLTLQLVEQYKLRINARSGKLVIDVPESMVKYVEGKLARITERAVYVNETKGDKYTEARAAQGGWVYAELNGEARLLKRVTHNTYSAVSARGVECHMQINKPLEASDMELQVRMATAKECDKFKVEYTPYTLA